MSLIQKLRIARELIAACIESNGSWLNAIEGTEARDAYFKSRERLTAALDATDDAIATPHPDDPETLERVARALYESYGGKGNEPWDRADEIDKDNEREAARIAISALLADPEEAEGG